MKNLNVDQSHSLEDEQGINNVLQDIAQRGWIAYKEGDEGAADRRAQANNLMQIIRYMEEVADEDERRFIMAELRGRSLGLLLEEVYNDQVRRSQFKDPQE